MYMSMHVVHYIDGLMVGRVKSHFKYLIGKQRASLDIFAFDWRGTLEGNTNQVVEPISWCFG